MGVKPLQSDDSHQIESESDRKLDSDDDIDNKKIKDKVIKNTKEGKETVYEVDLRDYYDKKDFAKRPEDERYNILKEYNSAMIN
jgi:hypothetical protein